MGDNVNETTVGAMSESVYSQRMVRRGLHGLCVELLKTAFRPHGSMPMR